jgi:hypothetical protein
MSDFQFFSFFTPCRHRHHRAAPQFLNRRFGLPFWASLQAFTPLSTLMPSSSGWQWRENFRCGTSGRIERQIQVDILTISCSFREIFF